MVSAYDGVIGLMNFASICFALHYAYSTMGLPIGQKKGDYDARHIPPSCFQLIQISASTLWVSSRCPTVQPYSLAYSAERAVFASFRCLAFSVALSSK
jgi:hypothetical protein